MSAVNPKLPQGDAIKPRQIVPTSEGYSLREGARPLVKPGASGQSTPHRPGHRAGAETTLKSEKERRGDQGASKC